MRIKYRERTLILLLLLMLTVTSIIWVLAVVYATTGSPEKFQYYVKALESMLEGLKEFFKAVIELFKEAVE